MPICAVLACAAAGVYSIVLHGKRDSHLLYRLEVPEEPGEVQRELRIFKEGKILLSVKSALPRLTPGPAAWLLIIKSWCRDCSARSGSLH